MAIIFPILGLILGLMKIGRDEDDGTSIVIVSIIAGIGWAVILMAITEGTGSSSYYY